MWVGAGTVPTSSNSMRNSICRNIVALLLVSLNVTYTRSAQDTYRIDPNQSTISFAVKHMVISTVHGKFTDYAGTILLNEADLTKSSVNITIKTASVNTEVKASDNDLRSA